MKVMIKERVEWKDVFTCGIEHCHSKIWEASFGNGTARPVKPSRLTVGSPLQSQRRRGGTRLDAAGLSCKPVI